MQHYRRACFCGLHADYIYTTHPVTLSSHASCLSPAVAHIDAAGMYMHIIMQGGVSGPAALCMELRGARPVESEREAQEQATLSDTCQHSHSTSLWTSNIHKHIHKAHNVHSHTHRLVARQICTHAHSPMACQIKVNVILSCLDSTVCELVTVMQYNTDSHQPDRFMIRFSQRSCTTCSQVSCSCLMLFVLIM